MDSGHIGLHEPVFAGSEWDYVKECLDTGWVSSVGKFVDRFEHMLEDYTGVKKAVAVVNGTAALHIALKLAGVERDDEVFVPDLTFVATANAVTYCGAIPHFVDSEAKTLGLAPWKLEAWLREIGEIRDGQTLNRLTGRRIKAVIAMHTFGHPVDLDPLAEVCEKYGLVLIEDAAESLGSFYKGRHTGNWGKLATLSFNGNKTVTTGGGGAILTNDEALGRLAKHLTTTAKIPHPWAYVHDQVGYNYRMPNINAALGCAQLEQLPGFLERKRKLAQRYQETLAEIPGISVFVEPEFARSNYWLNALILDETFSENRDILLGKLQTEGIISRPAWTLMHYLSMYNDCPRMDLGGAIDLEKRIINIPSGAAL
ncbi:MAG: LegC family aminotransferase [Desulfitobacteriaceae bacterium]|nr:LegC family aminotransferase [Desulfitobacteriaceae bacterium]MDI6879455.1 LegC family aminotransferase [Desulfitobacteriaceae bacterium]MDI6912951.1 LegC family aminotransferase [Desulfitobacteriaceae bacterium]